jgi:hypothetical protein
MPSALIVARALSLQVHGTHHWLLADTGHVVDHGLEHQKDAISAGGSQGLVTGFLKTQAMKYDKSRRHKHI